MPEPSRLPYVAGSSTGSPEAAAAQAGPRPAQPSTISASPVSSRWQRTPPVARPFRGYSDSGVTLTDDAVPGPRPRPSAGRPPAVTTTGSSTTSSTSSGALRSTALKPTTEAPAASFIPAMPPAERPCGRTAEAGKRSRSPVEANSTSSSSPSTSSLAPTTSSPDRSAMTSTASPLTGHSGATRLTTPCRVTSTRPGPVSASADSARIRSPRSSEANSEAGAPPRSDSAPVVTAGTAGRSRTPMRRTRPAEVTSPTWPRVVVRATDTTTS